MKKENTKTYSIEQFRAQLESEAMKRCDQQEAVIKKLHEEIKMLKDQIHSLLVNEKAYEREIARLQIKISRKENNLEAGL